MKKKLFIILRDYGIITLSCLIYAFAFNCFFQPNNLAMGGFTGLAQVLNKLFPVLPVGTTVFVMNVPLMIIGVKKQGWGLLVSSVYAITVSSFMIDTMAALYTFPTMDPLLACLYGGVLMGISLGLMMLKNATTGGTELAARLLKYVIRNLSIGKLCLTIDITVVSFYALTFGNIHSALYGAVAMYVCSLAMDMVVYGSINAKLAYIISDRCEEITEKLMEMELGATLLTGKGAYTGSK
ncbi:MAG: YitT family protein, partial [Oscillospiraceae bacterium]|nr:YitT family protein [Oscillospiraceae bacterium]